MLGRTCICQNGQASSVYRLLLSETPNHQRAVDECAKAIMELGSASAVMHDPRQPELRYS
jgi:hypothetical protein